MFDLPKVLLMGLRKSGKSSIQQVVFGGMTPDKTSSLPTTVTAGMVTSKGFLNFEVWDFPGQTDPFDPRHTSQADVEQLLSNCGVIVFVLDCREQVDMARMRLVDTICNVYQFNPKLCVEVFIHKVDALSEDHQNDLLIFLESKVKQEVAQRQEHSIALNLSFNLTSIYDHSVFQAFSLVVQRLIKSKQPKISELLQKVNTNCGSDVSYLFLSRTKIFLALDACQRFKLRSYDLCSDAIEVLVETVKTYNHGAIKATREVVDPAEDAGTDEEIVGKSVADPPRRLAKAIVHLSDQRSIYVRELPHSLTIVLMIQNSYLSDKVLIDQNLDACYQAVQKVFSRR